MPPGGNGKELGNPNAKGSMGDAEGSMVAAAEGGMGAATGARGNEV
jgi:hypothetical protein